MNSNVLRGRRGRDRMAFGFTTTCAISVYHHLKLWVRNRSRWGVLDTTCNATFNNISVISWWSVLLVEETRKKPPTCHKSPTNFITCWFEYTWVSIPLSLFLYITFISLNEERVWSIRLVFFLEVPVPSQENGQSCICVRGNINTLIFLSASPFFLFISYQNCP
jgi:hypothetical protein